MPQIEDRDVTPEDLGSYLWIKRNVLGIECVKLVSISEKEAVLEKLDGSKFKASYDLLLWGQRTRSSAKHPVK